MLRMKSLVAALGVASTNHCKPQIKQRQCDRTHIVTHVTVAVIARWSKLVAMEPDRTIAIETLRASMALPLSEANRLSSLIENSVTPDIRLFAQSDLERLQKRIQAQADELAKLESKDIPQLLKPNLDTTVQRATLTKPRNSFLTD
jgi:hypothetical protein